MNQDSSSYERLGDYLVSDLSGRQLLTASVSFCLAVSLLAALVYLALAFSRRDPKSRHDWLEGTWGRRLFRFFCHGLVGALSVGVCRLIGFPGQTMPLVALIALFLPFGFLIDVVYGILLDPWQSCIRRAPRRCPKCGKAMSLRVASPLPVPEPGASPIDFDEWACVCGAVRIDGYGGGKPLSDCPKCGFKTWQSRIETLRTATSHADGEGIDHRHCAHCAHAETVSVVMRRHA